MALLQSSGTWPDKCDARTILESDLQEVVVDAIDKTLGGRDTFLPILRANIATVISDDTTAEMVDIDTKLEYLQRKLLNRVNAKADYEDKYTVEFKSGMTVEIEQ